MFSQVDFSAKDGAFIDTTEELNSFIARTMIPKQDLDKLFRHELVDGVISRKTEDLPDYDEVGGNNQKFPHEYAFSGWFKWESV